MYRYTTPTLPVTRDGVDFDDVSVFRIAIEQGSTELLKVIDSDDPSVDAEHKTIYIPLTQEETASFKEGHHVQIQARIKYVNGTVLATNMVSIPVKNVLDEVII